MCQTWSNDRGLALPRAKGQSMLLVSGSQKQGYGTGNQKHSPLWEDVHRLYTAVKDHFVNQWHRGLIQIAVESRIGFRPENLAWQSNPIYAQCKGLGLDYHKRRAYSQPTQA